MIEPDVRGHSTGRGYGLHWWLRHHRHAFVPCTRHCGCDCCGSPCRHDEFKALFRAEPSGHGGVIIVARCAHCGYVTSGGEDD